MEYSKGDAFKEAGEAKKTFVHKKTGGINPIKALYDIETSIRNARATYVEDANGIPALFSTNMYVLAEHIQPLLKEGLDTLQKKEAERAALYKASTKEP